VDAEGGLWAWGEPAARCAFFGISIVFHTHAPLLQTFWHLAHADVLVQSRSRLSELAAQLSHVALSFAQAGNPYGPNGAQGAWGDEWRYDHCGEQAGFNVCCEPTTGVCPREGQERLLAVIRRRGFLRHGR